MALEGIRDWHELVALTPKDEEDRPRVKRLLDGVVGQLSTADAAHLVTVCDEGTVEQRYAALSILFSLVANGDPRLTDGQRARYGECVRATASRLFPIHRLGLRAFGALRELDKREAEDLLLLKLEDVSTMTEQQADWLVLNLSSMGSRRAVAALRGAKGLPPGAGATRDRFIKRIRNERPELLES